MVPRRKANSHYDDLILQDMRASGFLRRFVSRSACESGDSRCVLVKTQEVESWITDRALTKATPAAALDPKRHMQGQQQAGIGQPQRAYRGELPTPMETKNL
jgi:hypothetical protein